METAPREEINEEEPQFEEDEPPALVNAGMETEIPPCSAGPVRLSMVTERVKVWPT